MEQSKVTVRVAVALMFKFYENKDVGKMRIYEKILRNVDPQWLLRRVQDLMLVYETSYEGQVPTPNHIIKPLIEATELEVEEKWNMFRKWVFKSDIPEKLQAEVAAIKKFVGKSFINRYGNSNDMEEKWFRKEFGHVYKEFKRVKSPLLATGEVRLELSDPTMKNLIAKTAAKMELSNGKSKATGG